MKALVTGGRGFIGSFLVEALLKKGFYVRCLLRNKTSELKWLRGLDIELYEGDITKPNSLKEAVQGVDYVFHLAGSTKAKSKMEFNRINAQGTKNLLEAFKKVKSEHKRFILVSSLAAAGPSRCRRPLTELDSPRPVSNYGRSKLMAETITLEFSNVLPVTIVRPPSVYGPREQDVFGYFKFAKQGWRPVFSGKPRYSSLIYVKDLVEGIILVSEKETAIGEIYFLSNDEHYSWDDFGDAIAHVLEVNPRRVVVPLPLAFLASCGFELIMKITRRPVLFNLDKYRELKETYWICDNSKAKKELGFRPRFSLEEGLRETAAWYFENRWI